jgi:hypothetical protein
LPSAAVLASGGREPLWRDIPRLKPGGLKQSLPVLPASRAQRSAGASGCPDHCGKRAKLDLIPDSVSIERQNSAFLENGDCR